jgi:AraC family transcriptional regulator
MPIPETTSVEAFERYVGGKCLRRSKGKAWRDIKVWVVAPSRNVDDAVPLPAVSEPFLSWTMSGEVEFCERENDGPWLTNRIKKGSFFLTTGGAPYDCCWESVSPEPFQAMMVFIELPLFQRAMAEVFGADAPYAHLQDFSAFTDDVLDCQMEQLHGELMRREASPLFVQGLAQTIAIHLVRNYAVVNKESRSGSPSLPGFKLKQITDWMTAHLAEEFNLGQLAAKAQLSRFHFTRLFKNATGMSPSRYHLNLRMDVARRLLRETKKGIVDIALDVGYSNPSRFAQLFRRESGLTPSEYRRQR